MTPYDLNLRHLMALSAIARLGSLSRAAEAVHLSQPALTQAVVKLESMLQHRLFDRQRDGITPTVEGLELIDRVDRAARELAGAFEESRPTAAPRRPPDGRAMLLRVTFTHLRAVIAAVQSGNFVLANRTTGISASAIHRAVRDFEQLAGVNLFDRRGRSVVPTEGARRFAAAARRAIGEIEAVIDDLAARRGEIGGRVAVGAMPVVRGRLIPEAVTDLHARQPGASVTIVDGPYRELFARLTGGELDMIVGALRTPNPSPDVVQTPLYRDLLAVVARSDHPLAGAVPFEVHALGAFPWVMAAPGSPKRVAWERMFRDGGVEPPAVAVECSSVLAIHGLLAEGDWLTLLSPELVSREVASGHLAVLGPPVAGGATMICISTRVGWRPSIVQAEFIRLLETRAAARRAANAAA